MSRHRLAHRPAPRASLTTPRTRRGTVAPPARAVRYVWVRSGVDLVLQVIGEIDSEGDPSFRAAVDLLLLSSNHPVLDLDGAALDSQSVDVVVQAGSRLAGQGRCLLLQASASLRRTITANAPEGLLLVGPSRG